MIVKHLHVHNYESSAENDGSVLLIIDLVNNTDDMLAESMYLHDFDPPSTRRVCLWLTLNRALEWLNISKHLLRFIIFQSYIMIW